MATTQQDQHAANWTLNGNGMDGGGPLAPIGSSSPAPQPDESIDDQPMTLVEHLKELRDRLVRMCIAILVGMIGGFFLAGRVIEYFRSVVIRADPNAKLVQTEATDLVSTYLKITLYLGVAIAMPVLVYQVIRFLAPGLTKTERRYVIATMPFAMIFFVGGVLFASLIAIPNMYHFLLGFSAGKVDNLIAIGSVFGFFSSLSLWAGIFFQLPIVMFLLAALGIVTYDVMRRARKYAAVGLMIAAAVITPTPDALSMLLIWAPMYLLFELGLILARFARRRKPATA
ncbi:MAG TPA: twin-arginine translocase subunit TatC [Thermomicrobiales bacterium]|jgi:sec-independent protein translocase protein TatC